MNRTIAITGGIGSGKSVVCHALRILGYPVYDCDSQARRLMDSDEAMRRRIATEISPEVVNGDGTINRKLLSAKVFADKKLLMRLNAIVHGAVRNDFRLWVESRETDICFVETAILYESGFDALVNEIWEVTAPEEVRIARVQRRSNLSVEEIKQRINAQNKDSHSSHLSIINDSITPILPRIFTLLQK